MMSLRPYYAVTHVVSQMISRYVCVNAPRLLLSQEEVEGSGIENWSRRDWYAFLKKELRDPSGLLPWLPQYCFKGDSEAHILLDKIDAHLSWCRSANAHYILQCDPLYPSLLREITQAPIGITILGDPTLLNTPKISVVGSRRTASLVLDESFKLGYMLGDLGITTVSGGAFGCDISAHSGVLSLNKKPVPAIVVFANGLRRLYPQGNRERFREIYNAGGVLLSERLWDQLPMPYDFPIRNRIISALSMWTLVMGATKHSGAMITARLALDQGREVSVFFPDKDRYYCDGCQDLIDDGASFFKNAEEFCCRELRI